MKASSDLCMSHLVVAMLVLSGCCLQGQAWNLPPRPELTLPVCKTPPVIDGNLDDESWNKAVELGEFFIFGGEGEKTDTQKVKVMRDDEWLYLAYDIKLPHPEAIEITAVEHDGAIAADDCVEVFVDPGTDGDTYIHYMLSVGNVRGERRCHGGRNKETTWNLPWRSATEKTDTGWRAEMALPLAVLAEEGDLGKMTINVCSSRRLPTLNFVGVPISARKEHASWAAVKHGFHEPGSFGLVKGLGDVKPVTPLLVVAQNIKTGNYEVNDDGRFFYEVSGSLHGFTEREGKVRIVLEDRPGANKGETVTKDLEVKGQGQTDFSLRVPVKVLAGRTAELSVCDPETGEVFQSVPLNDMADLSLMRAYPRYSYYTTEPELDVVCELGLPKQELKKVKLVALDSAGKEVVGVDNLTCRTMLRIPAKSVTVGENSFKIELRRMNGDKVVSENIKLVKRPPKPGCEWKIDFGNGCMLNNGKPFFPFAIMAYGVSARDEYKIKDIVNMGFNTIVRWNRNKKEESIVELLEMADKYDFYVVDFPKMWNRVPTDKNSKPPEVQPGVDWLEKMALQWDWSIEQLYVPGVRKVMNHPRLIAWDLWDEPKTDPKKFELIRRLNNAIYRVDGYHPTMVLYIPPVPDGDMFTENCDLLCVDPYWVPGGGAGEVGNPNRVGKHSWLVRRRADRDLKLGWVTPCAERWSGINMRIIAPTEQRVQTYLSLMHGAQGLLYFVYHFQHQGTYETFRQLGKEMKILGPACLEPPVEQDIKYSPVAFDPLSNVFPDVQVSLKRNPSGGYILLAANWRPYPVDVDYRISLLGKSGKVDHLFDSGKSWKVKDGGFKDHMNAMDTRAYAVSGPSKLSDPVDISVKVKALRSETDAFYTRVGIPLSGVPGKKNIMRNSSFEEASIPGMPDYYADWAMWTGPAKDGYRVGDTRGDCQWELDTTKAWHGKNSVRMTADKSTLRVKILPPVEKPTEFTFSGWVCSDGGKGVKLRFVGPGLDYKKVYELTNKWERVSQTGILSPGLSWAPKYGFRIWSSSGTNNVWIDAIQLEEGTEATEYEP